MRTIMVDGREVMVDAQMTGQQITELAKPGNNEFAVVVRNNGDITERIPVTQSKQPYRLNDGDSIDRMYRVQNGE